jgi:hypothetical protein
MLRKTQATELRQQSLKHYPSTDLTASLLRVKSEERLKIRSPPQHPLGVSSSTVFRDKRNDISAINCREEVHAHAEADSVLVELADALARGAVTSRGKASKKHHPLNCLGKIPRNKHPKGHISKGTAKLKPLRPAKSPSRAHLKSPTRLSSPTLKLKVESKRATYMRLV